MADNMQIRPGTTLRQYRLAEAIGAGGMGEVYRARDTNLERDVAVKVLPASVAQDPDRLARFKREAQVLASLNHPNIAAIYGLEDAGEALFLVLELVEGEDLPERLKRGRIPLDDTLAIAKQIADAFVEAHDKGIVHRDLKPANVKLTPGDKVKVLDFGLAKAAAGDASGSGSFDLENSPTMTQAATVLLRADEHRRDPARAGGRRRGHRGHAQGAREGRGQPSLAAPGRGCEHAPVLRVDGAGRRRAPHRGAGDRRGGIPPAREGRRRAELRGEDRIAALHARGRTVRGPVASVADGPRQGRAGGRA
jgi:serine/threonine protein kinase